MSLQISSNPAPNEERRSKIQGSGEMADRIREYRWEDTPLGAIGTWSETLITAVNLMLFSPFSFAIFWGEEQILLYNDIYRSFLSDKHPQALASKATEVWAEAWDVLGGPVRAAFQKGISTGERAAYIPILVEGEMQDRWWTYWSARLEMCQWMRENWTRRAYGTGQEVPA